jgi:hypothetical protein
VAIVAVIAITKKPDARPVPVGITAGPPVNVGTNVVQGSGPAQATQGAQPANTVVANNAAVADAGVSADPPRATTTRRTNTRRTTRGHGEDNMDSVLMGQPTFR